MDTVPVGSSDSMPAVLAQIAERITDRGPRRPGPRSEQLLEQLTVAAVASVPGATYAGLTMRDGDGLQSRAPSDPLIADLDRLQAEWAEGPCVTTLTPGTSSRLRVPDFALPSEQRWPRFGPAAVERGVRSLLSFAMAPYEAPSGALNLYSTVPDAFDETAQAIAGAFATQAAVLVYGATAVADLEQALTTRDVIGQAKGIVMERFGLDDHQAFSLLVRYSQHTNTKLHDVAREVTAGPVRRSRSQR